MISKDVPSPPQRLRKSGQEAEDDRASQEYERHATMTRLLPPWMKVCDPYDGAEYDPYSTGTFRVLAVRPPRRTLDGMGKLDEEIRRRDKLYQRSRAVSSS